MAHERTRTEAPARSQARTRYPRIQTFSSLKSRDYRLLWTGNIFNNMASWLQLITLGWLVWELTKDPETGQGSALLSGTAAGLRGFPTLVIGPWAGVLVDRLDRRKMVIVAQVFLAVAAVFFAFLVASGAVQVWYVFVYASISAVGNAVLQPARQALVVNTVPPGDLGNAFALNAMTVTANRLIGAMIGGLLITTVGIKWNFFVEGGAYVVMALLLIPMRTPYQQESNAWRSSVLTNLKDGIGYIWKDNRIILHLIVLSLILNLAFLPIPALLPAYTGGVLHLKANVGGFLMAAQGVGGFIATFVIASLGFGIKKGKVGLIALVVGSAAILALAQSHWLLLSLAMMAFLGFSQTSFIVSNQTLLQSMIPDTLRGRVTSLYTLEHGLGPLAIFLIGLLIDLYTASVALTVVASVSLALSLYFLFTFRQVRRLE
jgi:MFS family permease